MVTNRCFTLALPVKQNKYCSFFLSSPHLAGSESARTYARVLIRNNNNKKKPIHLDKRCMSYSDSILGGMLQVLFIVSVKVYSGQTSVESA